MVLNYENFQSKNSGGIEISGIMLRNNTLLFFKYLFRISNKMLQPLF